MRLLACLVTLALACAAPVYAHTGEHGSAGSSRNGASMVDPHAPAVQIGGPFALVDGNNKPFTEKNLLGKYALVFFGFTFCPDICPTELQNAAAALDMVGPEIAAKTNIVFISIDPKRDTPAVVGKYVRQFGDNIIGLTGTPEQVAVAAKAFKVYYARSTETDPGDDQYMMEHSSFLYLMGPDGKYITVFRSGTDPDKIADELKKQVASH